MERPNCVKNEYLEYLDNLLCESWVRPRYMSGATPSLIQNFPELSNIDANIVLLYWMGNFPG
jgi:hypothetical protein